jgi:membrane-bound metal-dependent hydrolase YbcI (DUF457 family)
MFVGHGLLAFALVVAVATRLDYPRRRALAFGAVAAAFATVPDVDIAYALVGVVGAEATSPLRLAETFWATGNVVHRGVTHSLVVAPVAAAVAGLLAARRDAAGRRGVVLSLAAGAVALGVVAGVTAVSGGLAGAVTVAFLLAVGVVATVAATAGVTVRGVAALALVGLVTHPFGDLFTGEPPAMFYPFDATLFATRVTLHPDPTLHLLAAFALELSTAWLALAAVARLYGVRPAVRWWSVGRHADGTTVLPRATLAAGYAATVLLIPAPTLDLSYPFVFSVLAVGALGVVPRIGLVRSVRGRARSPTVALPSAATAALTGLTAVTVAAAAYTLAYLWVSVGVGVGL